MKCKKACHALFSSTATSYNKGLTLIEVMIAATVFSIGTLGLLSLMIYSAETNRTSQQLMIASSLARSQLETLLAQDYTTVVDGYDANNLDRIGNPISGSTYASQDGFFARSWTVVENTSVKYKQITVEVRWFDHQARSGASTGIWRNVILSGGLLNTE